MTEWEKHLEGADERLRKASALRRVILEMKFSARDAYRRGEHPFEPEVDIRSDPEYWERIMAEQGATFEAPPLRDADANQ